MSITLQVFANNDTDYVTKLNSNNSTIAAAINGLQSGTGTINPISITAVFNAIFQGVCLIGTSSCTFTISGNTVSIALGYVWEPAQNAVVLVSAQNLNIGTLVAAQYGGASGTYYLVCADSTGVLTLSNSPANALYSVVWTGSLGAVTRVCNVFLNAIDDNSLSSKPYDVMVYVPGTYTNGQKLVPINVVRPFSVPAGLTGSDATLDTATTGAITFVINRNGSSIGTINFAAGATIGTFTFAAAVSFTAVDIITIVAPVTSDTTAAGLSVTFLGTTSGNAGTTQGTTSAQIPDSVQLIAATGSVGFAGATNTLVKAVGGGGGITLTVVTAIGVQGQRITLKKTDSGAGVIHVIFTAGQTADGASSADLGNLNQFVVLESDNANWMVVGGN